MKKIKLTRVKKSDRYDISCLQDTHITKSDIELWKKEWHGELFAMPGTVHSNGLIILLRNRFEVSDLNCIQVTMIEC